jgi:predicted TIM-barrel fold metal-dependent hydrolase
MSGPRSIRAGRLDVHAHLLTPEYREELRRRGHAAPDGFPVLPEFAVDPALATMDELGIAAAVLSVSSPGVHLGDDRAAVDLARHVNDAGADIVARHPRRFGMVASLPLPDVGAAMRELGRALDELGADGVTLPSNAAGIYPGDASLAPLWEELDRRAAVVVLHPVSPPAWQQVALGYPRPMIEFFFETTRAVVDLVLSGTLRRHPRVRVIVPHAGALLPSVAARVAGMAAIVDGLSELAPAEVMADLAGLHYDLAGFSTPVQLQALLEIAAPTQLLYGSDLPFSPPAAADRLAASLEATPLLDDAQREAMFTTNAERLFPRLAPTS